MSYIRADETPHVEYLRTSLTEMRDRTFVGESGKHYAGTEIIGSMWDVSLKESLGILEEQNKAATIKEIERADLQRSNGRDMLAEFHSLADPVAVAS